MKSQVKFSMFADLHHNIMHDSKYRLKTFLDEALVNESDFMIQLGDFSHPDEYGKELIDMYNNCSIDGYHVLGNHDMDDCDKTKFMNYYGIEKNYYSFSYDNFLFVVLDTNFLYINKQYIDYDDGNFYRHPKERTYISDQQLEWLQNTIRNTDKYVVLFSHAALYSDIQNSKEVCKILDDENTRCGYTKIIIAFNGHTHVDDDTIINGIHYIEVNSISNQWLGDGFETIRFSEEITKKHPNIKYTAPYKDPIYQTVTLSSDGMVTIEGKESSYVGKTPLELGHPNTCSGHTLTPSIESRSFTIIT